MAKRELTAEEKRKLYNRNSVDIYGEVGSMSITKRGDTSVVIQTMVKVNDGNKQNSGQDIDPNRNLKTVMITKSKRIIDAFSDALDRLEAGNKVEFAGNGVIRTSQREVEGVKKLDSAIFLKTFSFDEKITSAMKRHPNEVEVVGTITNIKPNEEQGFVNFSVMQSGAEDKDATFLNVSVNKDQKYLYDAIMTKPAKIEEHDTVKIQGYLRNHLWGGDDNRQNFRFDIMADAGDLVHKAAKNQNKSEQAAEKPAEKAKATRKTKQTL